MPTLEQIRSLKITASTTGVAQATAELKGLSAAQTDVAKTAGVMATETDKGARKQLPIAEQYRKQTLALDESARALDRFQKAKAVADQALAQGVILGPEHAQRVADLTAKYEQASVASRAFGKAASGVSGQLTAMAAGFGPVGVFLSALGPWGMTAAVGLQLASAALNAVRESAAKAGEKARDLVELSEVTKLSIDELRGLKQAAGRFGVDEDKLETWLTKAAISMETARTGWGELADALTAVAPSFLVALQNASTFAERLDVLAQAAKAAKEQGKDVGLFWRDVFGRGSGRADAVMEATQAAGGIAKVGETMKQYGGAAAQEIKDRAHLSEEIKKLKKELDALNTSYLQATPVLQAEKVALEAEVAAMRALNAEKNRQVAVNEAVVASQNALIVKYGDEKRVIDEAAEAEAARAAAARGLSRSSMRSPTADRDMALQEGATPAAAITPDPKKVNEAAAAITNMTSTLTALEQAQSAVSKDTKWIEGLGGAATAAEKAILAVDRLNVAFEANAFGAKNSKEANELFNRALAEVAVQANALTATHQAAIQTLQARTAAEREAAAAATVRAGGGGDAEVRAQQAVTMEIEKQAQAHRDAMNAMEGQLQMAIAVTEAEKAAAQEAITYNELIRQGRTEEQAAAEAGKQRQITQAQADASATNQIYAIQQQIELINTRSTYEANEVKLRQAYDNAIRNNVSSEKALALVSAMRHQQEAEALAAEENARANVVSQQPLEGQSQALADQYKTIQQIQTTEANRATAISNYNAKMELGLDILNEQKRVVQEIAEAAAEAARWALDFNVGKPGEAGSSTAERIDTGIPWEFGTVHSHTPYIPPAVYEKQAAEEKQAKEEKLQKQINEFEMRRVEAQIGGDKPAEIKAIQDELAFFKSQPRSLEQLNQIKSLTDALKELTDATKAQTATLDDIYGSGHAALRIGYYNEGTSTQTIGQPTIATNDNVWRSPITTAPPTQQAPAPSPLERYRFGIPAFAEGGTVTRPTLALVGESGPEEITPIRTSAVNKRGSGPPTVVQNFVINMPARSDLGDRTTQRQAFEGIGRRAAAVR